MNIQPNNRKGQGSNLSQNRTGSGQNYQGTKTGKSGGRTGGTGTGGQRSR